MTFLTRLAKLWVLVLFMILGGYFALFNEERVALSLPPVIEHVSLPGYVLVLAMFLIGSLVSSTFFGYEHVRSRLEIRRLTRELQDARGSAGGPAVRMDRDTPLK